MKDALSVVAHAMAAAMLWLSVLDLYCWELVYVPRRDSCLQLHSTMREPHPGIPC